MSGNLPPGVRESDIPGNRPEDVEWEAFMDWVQTRLSESDLDFDEMRSAVERGIEAVEEDNRIERMIADEELKAEGGWR